jgi:hypothetical protein
MPISINDTTFCIWRKYTDNEWNIGNIDFPDVYDDHVPADGSQDLLFILDGNPETYLNWADDYYSLTGEKLEWRKKTATVYSLPENFEIFLDIDLVKYIYNFQPLKNEIIKMINPYMSLRILERQIELIGYPIK